MITGVMLGNEPSNLSHWNFQVDPEWRRFSAMITGAGVRLLHEASAGTDEGWGDRRGAGTFLARTRRLTSIHSRRDKAG
jgi:hypothetical protein